MQQHCIDHPEWKMIFKATEGLSNRALDDFEAADNNEGYRSRSGETLLDWLIRNREDTSWAYEREEAPAEKTPQKSLSEMTATERLDYANGASPLAKGIGGRDDK